MEMTFRDPIIYYIGGKAQHGKTTVGKMIKEYYEKKSKKVAVLQHSKYIKDYAKDYFGWDGSEETKPRELLQQLSGQLIKEKLGKHEIFINRIIEDIEILSYFFDCIVVDDVRIKNEFLIPKKKFNKMISIKLVRPNFDNGLTLEQQKHITETDLDDFNDVDYVILNDKDIEGLRNKIYKVIEMSDKNAKDEQ